MLVGIKQSKRNFSLRNFLSDLSTSQQALWLGLFSFLIRIVLCFPGYGVEEDSWGTALAVRNMRATGVYEASRLPGHPVQEVVLVFLGQPSAWLYNALSAMMGAWSVVAFFLALKRFHQTHAGALALVFSLVPVSWLAGTYTIDYAWGMAFVMSSVWVLSYKHYVAAGILLGLAAGCRITSIAMFLPFCWLIPARAWWSPSPERIRFAVGTLGMACFCFLPAYVTYGPAFFDYSDQFPYPNLPKWLYKSTIGVWGLPGFIALLLCFLPSFQKPRKEVNKSILLWCWLVIILYGIVYVRLPQKSYYVLGAVPAVLVMLPHVLLPRRLQAVLICLGMSGLVFGVNLVDPNRGSTSQPLGFQVQAAGQRVALEPFSGLVWADHLKRNQKEAFVALCMQVAPQLGKAAVVSGWWYNQLLMSESHPKQHAVTWVFYASADSLYRMKKSGFRLFYLPEQDRYNDLMFGADGTATMAAPFPVSPQ